MKRFVAGFSLVSLALLQACAPAATPAQQAQREHEIACVGGTIAGSLIGGSIGNMFGGGTGQSIARAAGAGAGAVAGSRYSC